MPQEYVQGINALGGQLENAFGIDVAQLVDVAHCGINKINVDTDLRLACTRNLLSCLKTSRSCARALPSASSTRI